MNVLESVNQYKDRISAELNNALTETDLGSLPKRKGKVRDQYDLGVLMKPHLEIKEDKLAAMEALRQHLSNNAVEISGA